jgi:hypothetical protein
LFRNLILELEIILYQDLLFINPKEINLNLNHIKNNINNLKIGFNLIDYYNKKQDLDLYKDLLINKLNNKTSLIYKFLIKSINNNNNIIFKKENIKKLYNNQTKFLQLLLVLIYLTSGAPIRGEDLVLLEYFNTIINKERNIFIEPSNLNLIRLETSYYKSYNITRLDKTNIRFLSPKLNQLLKMYLLIVGMHALINGHKYHYIAIRMRYWFVDV